MSTPADAISALIATAVEQTIARLLPFVVKPRPEWTTPRNAKSLFDKSWRALDVWAAKRGLARCSVAGSPCYRTTDLDAAIAATATTAATAPANEDGLDDYRREVRRVAGGR